MTFVTLTPFCLSGIRLVTIAEAGVGDELRVGIAPGLLAEMRLGVVDIGAGVEHAGMVEAIGLGLVDGIVKLGLGNLPGVYIGPAVLDFGACSGAECHGCSREYDGKCFFHCIYI